MTACANCSKNIRTANGMAFHLTWCKPAQPATPSVPDPLPAIVEAPMHPVLAHLLRGVPLPDGYRIVQPGDADDPPETPDAAPDPRIASLEAAERLANEEKAWRAQEHVSAAARRKALRAPVVKVAPAPEKITARRLAAKGRARGVTANRPLCLQCRANYRNFYQHQTTAAHLRATRPATSHRADAEVPAWMIAMRSYRETGSTYDHAEPEPVWDGIPQAA